MKTITAVYDAANAMRRSWSRSTALAARSRSRTAIAGTTTTSPLITSSTRCTGNVAVRSASDSMPYGFANGNGDIRRGRMAWTTIDAIVASTMPSATGYQRRDMSRPFGTTRSAMPPIPATADPTSELNQTIPRTNGRSSSCGKYENVAYSSKSAFTHQTKPAERMSQPTAMRGCRAAMRAPIVAQSAPMSGTQPRNPKLRDGRSTLTEPRMRSPAVPAQMSPAIHSHHAISRARRTRASALGTARGRATSTTSTIVLRGRDVRGSLILVAFVATIFAACAPASTPTTAVTGSGGTFTYGVSGDAAVLDPWNVTDDNSLEVTQQIFEPLLTYDAASFDVKPNLAVSWTVSNDRRQWTLKLRDGVTFHDGTPFDSDAVVFNFERARFTAFPYRNHDPVADDYSYYQSMLGGLNDASSITKVEAFDRLTVRFTTR